MLQSQITNRRKTTEGKEVTQFRGKDPGRGTGIVSLIVKKTKSLYTAAANNNTK